MLKLRMASVASLCAALLGCGGGHGGTTPTPAPTAQCGVAAQPPGNAIKLASAALLSATVVVDEGFGPLTPCMTLMPGSTVHVHVGDTMAFVANGEPRLSTDGVVTVTTAPGPTTTFGALKTSHLIVTLTALSIGTVDVQWFNCSGTGC